MKYLLKIAATLCSLIFCLNAFAQLPPFPVDPFLDSWSFADATNWTSDEGYPPIAYTNIQNVSCWATDDGLLDCNALLLDSTNAALLNYKLVESNNHTNLALTEGTIWFWFSPDWGSTNLDDGSTGPEDWGRFVDVGAWTTNSSYGWWSLYVSPDGNNIYFSGQTNGVWTNYLNAPISWSANSWHLIGLTYTPTNSILYLDDQIATNGLGVTYWPGHDAQTNGFYLGSDYSGTQQARGQFVDFETWNIVFPDIEFSSYYDEMLSELPGTGFISGGGFAMDFGVGGFSSGLPSGGGVPSYVDGTNLWLQITGVTNAGASQTAYFTLWPPTNVTASIYDLYYTTNLDTDVDGLNGTNWAWVLRTGAGQTNLIVTNLTADNNFFRLGLTTDTDGDGMSDAFEQLVSHTDPANADQNTNGIPDGWEWHYFGNLNLSSNADYAGDGNTILYDYQNGIDPNIIQFSMEATNDYVNVTNVSVQLNITAGVPSYFAVLVNDTNQANANWQAYTSSNIVVTLGATNGVHNVQVGLRGLPADAQQSWLGTQLTLDTVAPVFTITNPTGSTVSVPMIQLQGLVSAPLSSLTFDVSNALGVVANQPGYWTPVFYDTNLLAFTTNEFQCYDVALTNGLNTITLHATDTAGNTATTNLSYTLSYAGVTSAPQLTVLWPTNNTLIGGNTFTIQAQMDDVTATISASITDTNGDTNAVSGLVERNGTVWFNGLPLNSGTNVVTLTATNAAGLGIATNLTVIQSSVSLTIDPISEDQANQSSVNVTGTVTPGNGVSVNGTAAYSTDDDGDWEADGVAVNASGMASLDVEVTDGDGNPVASQTANQPQPAAVGLMSYASADGDTFTGVGAGEGSGFDRESYGWSYLGGGNYLRSYFATDQDDGGDAGGSEDEAVSAGEGAFSSSGRNLSAAWTFNNVTSYFGILEGAFGNDSVQAQTRLMIDPSGQNATGTSQTYLVAVSALAFSDPHQISNLSHAGDVPLAPETLKVNGQTLVSSGLTNDDGTVNGLALITAPAGVKVPVSVTVSGGNNYSFKLTCIKTKADWQREVQQEIDHDSLGLDIQNFKASNTFIKNSPYIKAVYAFYAKVYLEQPTEYYWAGLANLAGADVYAGLSDANHIPGLSGFQSDLMQMHLDILNDLGWQFEAYRKGGLQALEAIYAVDILHTNLDANAITAWRSIDQGIQENNQTLILTGNQNLLKREQQQVLPNGYAKLSSFDTSVMSDFAECPVWDPATSEPYAGRDFDYVMQFVLFDTNPFNIANTDDRWNWITAPTVGIWDTWVNLPLTDKTNEVSTALNARAITYSIFPASFLIY